jgi:hypothetical protein
MSYKPYNTYQPRPSQAEKLERHQIISDLIEANSFFYYLPYLENLAYNFAKYSNETLKNIMFEFRYSTNFEGNPDLKQIYDELLNDYQKAYQKFAEESYRNQ